MTFEGSGMPLYFTTAVQTPLRERDLIPFLLYARNHELSLFSFALFLYVGNGVCGEQSRIDQ